MPIVELIIRIYPQVALYLTSLECQGKVILVRLMFLSFIKIRYTSTLITTTKIRELIEHEFDRLSQSIGYNVLNVITLIIL